MNYMCKQFAFQALLETVETEIHETENSLVEMRNEFERTK